MSIAFQIEYPFRSFEYYWFRASKRSISTEDPGKSFQLHSCNDVTKDLKEAMSTVHFLYSWVMGATSVSKTIFSLLYSEQVAYDYFSTLTFHGKVSSCKERTEMSKKSLREEVTYVAKFLGDNYRSTGRIKKKITLTFSVKPFVVFFGLPSLVWIKLSSDFSQQWFFIFPDL